MVSFTLSSAIALLAAPLLLSSSISAHPHPRSLASAGHLNCLADVLLDVPVSGLKRRAEEIKFGYGAADGPLTWPGVCQTGQFQSPIDLVNTTLLQPPSLNVQLSTAPFSANFTNLGTTVQVTIPESLGVQGHTAADGTFFKLKQFHFHITAEHTKNSQVLPMEMHMVHATDAGRISVIGVLFEMGATPNPFLAPVIAAVPGVAKPEQSTTINNLSFAPLLPLLQTSKDWIYNGSLTTPPCTEGVLFNVVDTPMTVTVEEWNTMRSVLNFNARLVVGNAGVGQPGFASGARIVVEGEGAAKAPEGAASQVVQISSTCS
ncbi:alpha carbonic anhydrase [Powellomyces hirtus]|nr:alpha carbonic anhydrase [Powellomyces hirtus]